MKTKSGTIVLANWGRRFIAWFVDYIVVNVLLAYVNVEQIESSLVPIFVFDRENTRRSHERQN